MNRITDLFTHRYRARSEFASDYDFRSYYAQENARVTLNYMLASLVLGSLLGALFMWIAFKGVA